MSSSKKLIFFGTEDFSAASLRKLIASGYGIAAVITKPDLKTGRGQKAKKPEVAQIAKEAGIKILQPAKIAEVKLEIEKIQPLLGILVAYGKIIPQSIIDLFPLGIVNLHPSLLPKYRGPSPIETAILNGDQTTGVSLMKLTAKMDEGPIYVQVPVEVYPGADRQLFSAYLAEIGAELLQKHLPAILEANIKPQPQNEDQASYTKLLSKKDGIISFERDSAEKIEREVRAFLGYPRSSAKLHGADIIITGSRVAEGPGDGLLVVPCDTGYLEIQELIAPSGRRMSGADFLRGYAKH